MFKRVFLFVLVNILVIVTIGITLSLLGVRPYLNQAGIDYQALLAFCAVVGFAGAFISLLMSKFTAKMLMNVEVIDPDHPRSEAEEFLLATVYDYARNAGIRQMPEVGIYYSNEVNAFATGPSKNNALVAVSSGLLERMDQKAVQGVIAHEVAHISNGDMVTMTLIQGVVNVFVMFLARVAAFFVAGFLQGENEEETAQPPSFLAHMLLTIVFEIFLSILGSMVVAFFSRIREFSADRGGADLAGRDKMIHALVSLKRTLGLVDDSHQSLATLKINGGNRLGKLLASHPDIDERIARLQE